MSEDRQVWPQDWSFQSLEKIASHITSGGTPTSGSPRYYLEHGGLPFAKTEDLTRARSRFIEECDLGISEAALKETAAKKYPVGTVLISMYGTIGLTKIAAIEMAANQALCALIPPLACDSGYLYHHLEYTRPGWLKYSGQTTQANINGSTVRSHQVPLPNPIEQRKIAQVLDALDTAIHATEAIIAKLKAVKQALLQDLLTRGIEINGEIRPPQAEAGHLYKRSPTGWIPNNWTSGPLECWLDGKPKNGYSPQEAGEWTGIQMLGLGCLTLQGLQPLQLKPAPRTDKRLSSALLSDGDLLMSRANTRELVGMVGVYRDVGSPCTYPDLMMRLRPSTETSAEFLQLVLQASAVRRQVQAHAVGTSESMVKISGKIVSDLVVAIPSKTEQKQILALFAAGDARLNAELEIVAVLRELKAGLMDDLLTGRVRVTPLLEGVPP
jgi:type I restriction enzyme S subunit